MPHDTIEIWPDTRHQAESGHSASGPRGVPCVHTLCEWCADDRVRLLSQSGVRVGREPGEE